MASVGRVGRSGRIRCPLQSVRTHTKRAAQRRRALVGNEDGLAAHLPGLTEFKELGKFSGVVSPEEMAQLLRVDVARVVSATPSLEALDSKAPPPQGIYA